VDEFKIVQHAVDRVEVMLKCDDELFPDDGNERIVKGIQKRMGRDVRVDVNRVEKIPRDASGKYRYVVSKVASFE